PHPGISPHVRRTQCAGQALPESSRACAGSIASCIPSHARDFIKKREEKPGRFGWPWKNQTRRQPAGAQSSRWLVADQPARGTRYCGSGRSPGSILAEIKLLRRLLAERIAQVALPAIGTEVVAQLLGSGRNLLRLCFFHLAEHLAEGLHVILVEVCLREPGRVMSGEHFYLHHEMMVLPGTEFLAAKITGDVQHR